MKKYNPKEVEKKWQKYWEKKRSFEVDLKKAKRPFYNLMMFPYPSAEGLHVGNVYAFAGSDIYGRLKRMQGFDVFEPMGFDAFGIHSENFAIQKRIHPRVLIKKNVNNFRRQLKNLGCLFDWSHEVDTTQPRYYKWTQWLFLQLFEAGLAYRKKAPVDWCPSCKTVLANEQVINGKCERCDSKIIKKELKQWFFKITKYGEKLLDNLNKIDWSERTKTSQRKWIGKSEGVEINFKISPELLNEVTPIIKVFTTRPDTIFGCTFLVLAPEHELITNRKLQIANYKEVQDYIKKSKNKSDLERQELKEKTGIKLEGIKAMNPANGEEIPVWVADYVLGHVGTGAIMAVPAHDERDRQFAEKFNLTISDAPLVNKDEVIKKVGGRKIVNYHLRDWLISRQRYWGPPIPIVYCSKCAIVPVPEKDLPVLLPYVKNFRPKGTGKSPLASVKNFVNTKCPKCKGRAKRETDVSDTFLDSAWYFLRYPSAGSEKTPFEEMITKKWLPVDMYIGGQEHAVLHLMYSRFITMILNKLGFLNFDEPFKIFRAHGLLIRGGAKMSKSRGNVVNPDEYYKKYGADTLRIYLMFLGPFETGGDWQDKGIIGVKRFLDKVWNLKRKAKSEKRKTTNKNLKLERLIHKTIKKVTEDIESLRYNTAISALMILTNEMAKEKNLSSAHYSLLITILAPFAPYITEEIWHQLGNKNSVHNQKWPKYNEKLIKEEKILLIIQVNGKVRDKIEASFGISQKDAESLMMKSEKIKQWIKGKKAKKIIFVPDKLINMVTIDK